MEFAYYFSKTLEAIQPYEKEFVFLSYLVGAFALLYLFLLVAVPVYEAHKFGKSTRYITSVLTEEPVESSLIRYRMLKEHAFFSGVYLHFSNGETYFQNLAKRLRDQGVVVLEPAYGRKGSTHNKKGEPFFSIRTIGAETRIMEYLPKKRISPPTKHVHPS